MVSTPDAPSIYDIPKVLHSEGLDAYVVRRLGPAVPRRRLDGVGRAAAPGPPPRPADHDRPGRQVHRPARRLPVAGRGAAGRRVRQRRQGQHPLGDRATSCETPEGAAAELDGVDGMLIPGGFGVRGIEGKIGAIRYARENEHPAPRPVPRPAVHGHRGCPGPGRASPTPTAPSSTPAHRTRSSPPWPSRRTWSRASATWAARCGWACTRPVLKPGTIVSQALWRPADSGGAAPAPLRGQQRLPGARSSKRAWSSPGLSPDGRLVEFVELPPDVHPFFVATQAHPEFLSRPTRPHPLFSGLIAAAIARSRSAEATGTVAAAKAVASA